MSFLNNFYSGKKCHQEKKENNKKKMTVTKMIFCCSGLGWGGGCWSPAANGDEEAVLRNRNPSSTTGTSAFKEKKNTNRIIIRDK